MSKIFVKDEASKAIMREAGSRLCFVMEKLAEKIEPGVSTAELDELAEKLILEKDSRPAFKGYGEKFNPFPSTICASINQEIVHGIPSEKRILREGDLFKIDIGLEYQGFFADMARTFPVGKISPKAQDLIEKTEKCFWSGVNRIKEGVRLSEYSKGVEECIKKTPYSIVRDLVGHGIGRALHEDPQVTNYFEPQMPDPILREGMALALEPMINEGTWKTKMSRDGWVFETADGKLSAHYENTILVTKKGVEVLTVKK